eukprot:Seg3702.2 transcript_id=Seg3702.2/GoldUCD/mRNA.D3Y31 product="hypothetical protein" protein_id=Seg3702.2/GoldUCD/D3Y31
MFLRKSRSKTELFVLLPNKHDKIMSPAYKQRDRASIDGKSVQGVSEDGKTEKTRKTRDQKLQHQMEEKLSKLILISEQEKEPRIFADQDKYKLIEMHEKYDSIKEDDFTPDDMKICSPIVESDQSWTSSDESPKRSSSTERKSVRFEDDLSDSMTSIGSYDGNVYPVSLRQKGQVDHNRNNCYRNRTPSPKCGTTSSASPVKKSQKSEPRGILCRTLSQNPFNLKKERSFSEESNFTCHECEKQFKYQSNLKTHVMTVHGGALFKSGSQKNVRSLEDLLICDVCSLVFKYSVNLRAHKAGHTRNKLNSTI